METNIFFGLVFACWKGGKLLYIPYFVLYMYHCLTILITNGIHTYMHVMFQSQRVERAVSMIKDSPLLTEEDFQLLQFTLTELPPELSVS